MNKQQPEALRLAEMLTADDEWPGSVTLVSYARECVAELLRQHAENETVRAGYAAARLEIESLKAQGFRDGVAPLTVQAADSQPAQVMGDTPPPCDQELFDQGVSVGLFDIPKWTAEALCRGIAAATEARVDWHYIGGRVHIKALPAARAPADSVQGFRDGVSSPSANAGEPRNAIGRDALIDAITQGLHGTWHCTRVWEAWHVGTMSQDDFEPVDESETPTEIADAVLALLAAPGPADGERNE